MATRTTRPVTVTLGEVRELADRRLRSGRYASMSEVVRAGLRALDREEGTLDAFYKRMIEEAMDDPRPPIPVDEAVIRLRALADARRAASHA